MMMVKETLHLGGDDGEVVEGRSTFIPTYIFRLWPAGTNKLRKKLTTIKILQSDPIPKEIKAI